uniref:Claudin n=1 Tax=Sphaeramia orbicularis TaxID=375764 RepID=A0A673CBK9_9TELE
MRAKLEVLALVLGSIALIGTIVATALPTWKVSAFIGANLIVMEDRWEGLWMNCYKQIDKMQCKAYDSLLILPPELQASRGLMCVSIILVAIALSIMACGTKKRICVNSCNVLCLVSKMYIVLLSMYNDFITMAADLHKKCTFGYL